MFQSSIISHTFTDHTTCNPTCSKCKKFYCVMTTRCFKALNEEPFVCSTCSTNTSSSKGQDKENVAVRVTSHSDKDFDFIKSCPVDKRDELNNLIIQYLFSDDKPDNKFNNFREAQVYFNSKFSYEKTDNLFKFHVPKCLEDDVEEDIFEEDNMFKISMFDIESCFDIRKHLSKGLVDFVLSCFNFTIDRDIIDDNVPKNIYGPIQSLNSLVPSRVKFSDIYKYLIDPESTSSEFRTKEHITTRIKHYYVEHSKGFLTEVIDKFAAQKTFINDYGFIHQLRDKTYVFFGVRIDPNSAIASRSTVFHLDPTERHKKEINYISIWIAKYFGLLAKDANANQLVNDDDFNGSDVKIALKFPERLKNDTESASIFNVAEIKRIYEPEQVRHKDTGIMCLVRCLADFSDSYFSTIPTSTKQIAEFCDTFRLSVLSLVADAYDLFNVSNYQELKYHILMMEGNSTDTNDLNKWRMIHELCNKGKFTDINERHNANSIFRKVSYDQIFSDYSKLKNQKVKEVIPLTPSQKQARLYAIEMKRKKNLELEPFWLCMTKHTRTQRVFDVSNKLTILRNLSKKEQEIDHIVNSVDEGDKLPPLDLVDDIADLLATRYAKATETVNERGDRKDRYEKMMKRRYCKTYFILDCKPNGLNLKSYSTIAALILEENLKFDDGSVAVIHSFAPDTNYDRNDCVKCLLSHVFDTQNLREKEVVFVSSYGENKLYFETEDENELADSYTMVDLFKEMKFIEAPLPSMKNDIIPGSTTMIGYAKDIVNHCKPFEEKKKAPGAESKSTYVVLSICNRVKYKFLYDGKQFMSYSHPFHWHKATKQDINQIPIEKQKDAKKNPNEEYYYSGSGHRKKSQVTSSRLVYAQDIHVKAKFLQSSYSTDNNCAWLSTACLIDRMDEADADEMIRLFISAKTNFEWIPIRGNKNEKDKKVSATSGKKSLMQLLNEHIGYTLYNVPLTKGYLEQILDDIKHGKYVCLLKFSNGNDKHVIGIDCDAEPKLIFDCMEDKAMPLTRENLNNLSGDDDESVFLQKITLCYKLVDNNKKRSYSKI